MSGTQAYRTEGNAALACRRKYGEESHGTATMIDFDIARRSHESRAIIAQQQANAMRTCQSDFCIDSASEHRVTLQEMALESYRPGRGSSETLGGAIRSLSYLLREHPLSQQLRFGGLGGRYPQRTPRRQLVTSGAVCTVIASVLVIVGC